MQQVLSGSVDVLLRPIKVGSMDLPNRVVMAPMTRARSPGGIPGADVAAYYERRALGGVGLIVSEGTWVPDPKASWDTNSPDFFGEAALAGWQNVLDRVHAAGAKMVPQLWHTGISIKEEQEELYPGQQIVPDQIGPSGLVRRGEKITDPMTPREIDVAIEAFVRAGETAYRMGFDGVELHGAHGYLIDQFFWSETNCRKDRYGGTTAKRSEFAAEIIRNIRARTAPDFPILLRISQWKGVDYNARMLESPQQMEEFLAPLVDAGVSIFDCSQRRFWLPEFQGSPLNLAGWVKKISGVPTISVGSVSLNHELVESMYNPVEGTSITSIDELLERMERNEFDLIAIGRALISDPEWFKKVRNREFQDLIPFSVKDLIRLY